MFSAMNCLILFHFHLGRMASGGHSIANGIFVYLMQKQNGLFGRKRNMPNRLETKMGHFDCRRNNIYRLWLYR